jgi:hypothetical protein
LHLVNISGKAVPLHPNHGTEVNGGKAPSIVYSVAACNTEEEALTLHQELACQVCLGVHSFNELRKLMVLCVNSKNNVRFLSFKFLGGRRNPPVGENKSTSFVTGVEPMSSSP